MLDETAVNACLSVQDNFFHFTKEIGISAPDSAGGRLFHSTTMTVDSQQIEVHCYNTAWCSRLSETAGQLFFPIGALPSALTIDGNSIAITVFHHPYGWLDPDNRRQFQRHIESTSDVVLTGHEHVQDYHRLERRDGRQIQYLEGAVFQGHANHSECGFNILAIDINARNQAIQHFQWIRDRFSNVSSTEPRPFVRNRSRVTSKFEVTPDFLKQVRDAGRGYQHPRKKGLELPDVFVYPNLRERGLAGQMAASAGKSNIIDSDRVIDHVVRSKRIFITGQNESGKTALCHSLFEDLRHRNGVIPILLSGGDIRGYDRSALLTSIEKAFKSQYDGEYEHYMQLEASSRVLIVDDFHRFRYNVRGQREFLAAGEAVFGQIIVVADEVLRFEEITEQTPFFEYVHCDIQPFGYQLRRQLIERWMALGQEYTTDRRQLELQIRDREHLINTLIQNDVLPPFAPTLLMVLQTSEAGQNHTLVAGAYGYYYEVLITQALAQQGTQIRYRH